MDDANISPPVEVREAAMARLKERIGAFLANMEELSQSIAECDALFSREELASELHPAESALHRAMHPFSFDVAIVGNLFHRLGDRDACAILKIIYRTLAPGATLFFTADKEKEVRRWCREFGDLVVTRRDGSALLVELRKLQ